MNARQLGQLLTALAISAIAAAAQTNFGSVNVGASATSTVTLTVANAVTLGGVSVLTQGATGLDFANAGTGTCAPGTKYAAGQTCTVDVVFKPLYAGTRLGEALLSDESGNPVAAASLAGIGIGSQVVFDPGAAAAIDPTVFGLSLQEPFGVAVDGAGDLFIADTDHARVVEIPAGGGAPTVIDPLIDGVGLDTPAGLIVDGAGDLFIADLGANRVVEVPAGGGAPAVVNALAKNIPLKYPCGMAFDTGGDLFIADVDNARVIEVPANGGATTVVDPAIDGVALSYPVALAFDSAGDLYISDFFANRVVKMPAGGGAPVAIDPTVNGQSLTLPYGIAVDGAGDLFIADANNRIVEVPAGGGAATALAPSANGKGLSDPIGIAINAAGDLFVADSYNDRVVKIARSQPPALNFAAAPVGSTSSDSPQTVEVENAGNALLTFPVPGSGNNPALSANFTLASGGSSNCPLLTSSSPQPGSLAAGEACTLPISFQPTATGAVYGTLALTDSHLNAAAPGYSTQTIALSGDSPVLALSAASLSFSAQQVEKQSASQQVTLTNTGSAALNLGNITVVGPDASAFPLTNPCPATLAPGASCAIAGQFAPAASGPMTASFTIADNAPGSPQTVALTGAGAYLPTVMVDPALTSLSTAQALAVTVTVSGPGGNPAPTGWITLGSGIYSSPPAALTGGSAIIQIPAGSLAVGAVSLAASYAPDTASDLLFVGASGSASVTVTPASTAAAPTAATGVTQEPTSSSVMLVGTVNPNGADTHAWFLYGTSATLAGATQTASQDIGSGNTPVATSYNLASGLSANTIYYFQIVAQNSVGTSSGAIGTFTTEPAPYFSMSTGAAIAVAPGATSANTSTLNVEPWYGFTGSVALSCVIAPVAASDPATCSVPASVAITGPAQPVTVTVATTAASASSAQSQRFWPAASGAAKGAALACIVLLGIPLRRRWRVMLGMLLLFVFATGMGCGSGGSSGGSGPPPNPGTSPGNYTITVTGVSGSMTESATIALTVQ